MVLRPVYHLVALLKAVLIGSIEGDIAQLIGSAFERRVDG